MVVIVALYFIDKGGLVWFNESYRGFIAFGTPSSGVPQRMVRIMLSHKYATGEEWEWAIDLKPVPL